MGLWERITWSQCAWKPYVGVNRSSGQQGPQMGREHQDPMAMLCPRPRWAHLSQYLPLGAKAQLSF